MAIVVMNPRRTSEFLVHWKVLNGHTHTHTQQLGAHTSSACLLKQTLDELSSYSCVPCAPQAARKRKISILKAQGKSTEAIRELNEYLEQWVLP